MSYTLFDFLQLIGSLGIFIFGMKTMSDGLQKVAGGRLRKILTRMTSTRIMGVFTGFIITVLTQSSTATTVMVVSFVNAGLLTFLESTGIIMGANLGTTVTAWIVAVFGFKMSITPIAIAMIGLFFPFLFSSNNKLKFTAESVIGFGVLFIGLEFLKASIPDIENNPEIILFLDQLTGFGLGSILIFIGIGALFTAVTQSSSATTALTLVMVFQGWMDFELAAAMMIGQNIGTTITANIAASIANIHAKRAAFFHLLFNLIGIIPILLIFPWIMSLIDSTMVMATGSSIMDLTDDPTVRGNATIGLSIFHTVFNLFNLLLLFAFVPALVKVVERALPGRGEAEDEFHLKFIKRGLMSTTALSIDQAHREIELYANRVRKMHDSMRELLLGDKKKAGKYIKRLEESERNSDNMEIEIAEYLTAVSEGNIAQQESKRIRNMLRMIGDIERIADLYYNMTKNYERAEEMNVDLNDESLGELKQLLDVVEEAFDSMIKRIPEMNGYVDLTDSIRLELKINRMRDDLKRNHYERLEKGIYSPMAGIIYLDYLNRLEKIGDHILNVNEAISGKK